MSSSFKTIALIGKHRNPDIVAPLLSLGRYMEKRNLEVLLDQATAAVVAEARYPVMTMEEIGVRADLAFFYFTPGFIAPAELSLTAAKRQKS